MQRGNSDKTTGANSDGILGGLLGHFKAGSGVGLVVDVLQAWWQKQPLNVGLILAQQVTTGFLQPIAITHPYRLVLAAAAVGG